MRKTPDAIYFHGGIFSNWAATPIDGKTAMRHLASMLDELGIERPADGTEITNRHKGRRHPNGESWMMSAKAWLMNDLESLKEIHGTSDPSRIKALGRRISPFDERLWTKARRPVVVSGSIAKFSATPRMRAEILDTGDRMLVEGSPYDFIWGVGLSWRDDLILDRRNWKGLNLLGECLMEARAIIAEMRD